jgi:hypothetical protein
MHIINESSKIKQNVRKLELAKIANSNQKRVAMLLVIIRPGSIHTSHIFFVQIPDSRIIILYQLTTQTILFNNSQEFV